MYTPPYKRGSGGPRGAVARGCAQSDVRRRWSLLGARLTQLEEAAGEAVGRVRAGVREDIRGASDALAAAHKLMGGPHHAARSALAAAFCRRGTIKQGYLLRTPRGRMVTQAAYRHFGMSMPKTDQSNTLSLDLDADQ